VYTPYKKKKVKTAAGNFIDGLIQGEINIFIKRVSFQPFKYITTIKTVGGARNFIKTET
jgi:hypothetical protein